MFTTCFNTTSLIYISFSVICTLVLLRVYFSNSCKIICCTYMYNLYIVLTINYLQISKVSCSVSHSKPILSWFLFLLTAQNSVHNLQIIPKCLYALPLCCRFNWIYLFGSIKDCSVLFCCILFNSILFLHNRWLIKKKKLAKTLKRKRAMHLLYP